MAQQKILIRLWVIRRLLGHVAEKGLRYAQGYERRRFCAQYSGAKAD